MAGLDWLDLREEGGEPGIRTGASAGGAGGSTRRGEFTPVLRGYLGRGVASANERLALLCQDILEAYEMRRHHGFG